MRHDEIRDHISVPYYHIQRQKYKIIRNDYTNSANRAKNKANQQLMKVCTKNSLEICLNKVKNNNIKQDTNRNKQQHNKMKD